MGDYISREALIKAVEGNPYVTESVKSYVRCTAKSISSADVVEVVHGEWKKHDPTQTYASPIYVCSECGDAAPNYYGQLRTNYCPNCGAKMDGEAENH